MKTLFASIVALLLLGTSFQTGVSADRVPGSPVDPAADLLSFRKLPAGQTIRVDYQSRGCFHSNRKELSFHGGSPLTVTAIDSI